MSLPVLTICRIAVEDTGVRGALTRRMLPSVRGGRGMPGRG